MNLLWRGERNFFLSLCKWHTVASTRSKNRDAKIFSYIFCSKWRAWLTEKLVKGWFFIRRSLNCTVLSTVCTVGSRNWRCKIYFRNCLKALQYNFFFYMGSKILIFAPWSKYSIVQALVYCWLTERAILYNTLLTHNSVTPLYRLINVKTIHVRRDIVAWQLISTDSIS